MYVCVPLASDQVCNLRIRKYGRTFDRALRALEREYDSGVLAGLAWSVKVRGNGGSGQILEGNGPRKRFGFGVESGSRLPDAGLLLGGTSLDPLRAAFRVIVSALAAETVPDTPTRIRIVEMK